MIKKLFILFFVIISFNSAKAELLTENLIIDDFVNATLDKNTILPPQTTTTYNSSSVIKLPVKLAITKNIKSENDVFEGQIVNFTVKANVSYKNKIIIKKDTPVTARIETTIKSGMNGIPAHIILGNFEIENIDKYKLSNFYEIKGQDRSLIVFPLKWALTFLPPSGSLTNFIKGGHAKLKTVDHIKIYYYPEL